MTYWVKMIKYIKRKRLIESLLRQLREEKDNVNQSLIDGEYDIASSQQQIAFKTGKALRKLLNM